MRVDCLLSTFILLATVACGSDTPVGPASADPSGSHPPPSAASSVPLPAVPPGGAVSPMSAAGGPSTFFRASATLNSTSSSLGPVGGLAASPYATTVTLTWAPARSAGGLLAVAAISAGLLGSCVYFWSESRLLSLGAAAGIGVLAVDTGGRQSRLFPFLATRPLMSVTSCRQWIRLSPSFGSAISVCRRVAIS